MRRPRWCLALPGVLDGAARRLQRHPAGIPALSPHPPRALRNSRSQGPSSPHSVGMPGMVQGAEHALRVRHHDGEAAVGGGQAGDALRASRWGWRVAARSGGRGCPRSAGPPGPRLGRCVVPVAKLGAALAVGHGNGQAEPAMPCKQQGGDSGTSTEGETRLELFRAVAHEARPGLGAGDQLCSPDIIWQPLQTPRAKVSVAGEEGGELVAGAGVEQDGLGPALAGAQHVAVGEAAAGGQAR
jgi:hypothetical protein